MIATLPMYDRPETAEANDRLWMAVRGHLGHGPDHLTRDGATHWMAPELILSQTCSLPYRVALHGSVMLVGAPVHDIDAPGGYYFSVLVGRADETRTPAELAAHRVAVNDPVSQSGWAALLSMADAAGVSISDPLMTGSHQASARAVAEGRADLAAIDTVTWKMMERWDDFAGDLRVLDHTPPTPALPYVTAFERDPHPIREALGAAIDELSVADRETLCLTGLTTLSADRYLTLPIPPAPCNFP